jgi:glycerol-3-phosphate dehydrogenase
MKRNLALMAQEYFDVIIVGGGISGVAIAREASLYGLKVALVEKKDFGAATSAATSKLIHGGLRYLKNAEFRLVRESLRERSVLLKLAPHLVYPLPFVVPLYKHSENSKWMMKIGLTVYDTLSASYRHFKDPSKNLPSHRLLSAEQILALEPKILLNGLTGGAIYYDAQSYDSERLTLIFLLSAVEQGAQAANYAQMTDFLREGNRICGIRVQDHWSQEFYEIRGSLVVNAGGPWADLILNKAQKEGQKKHQLLRSQGIHLVTRPLTQGHALLLQTQAKRHFFILPWRGLTLIGTTDTPYDGHPDDYQVSSEQIEKLLEEVHQCYGVSLDFKDILYAYGGLRPLIDTEGESYQASRRYEIEDYRKEGIEGLLTVMGGKYTTSRQLAFHVLKRLCTHLGKTKPDEKRSLETPLSGGNISEMEVFVKKAIQEHPDFPAQDIERLCRERGTAYPEILELAKTPEHLLEAEVRFAIRHEMAYTLEDLVFRRLSSLGPQGKPSSLNRILQYATQELGWNDQQQAEQLRLCQKHYTSYLKPSGSLES